METRIVFEIMVEEISIAFENAFVASKNEEIQYPVKMMPIKLMKIATK